MPRKKRSREEEPEQEPAAAEPRDDGEEEEDKVEDGARATELVLGDKTFDTFGLAQWLVATLSTRMHITHATKIQETAIPVLLSDRDAFIKAETGSGKTLAYAIPLAHKLGTTQPPITRADGLRAIIVAPTRELCQQIFSVIRTLLTSFIRQVIRPPPFFHIVLRFFSPVEHFFCSFPLPALCLG